MAQSCAEAASITSAAVKMVKPSLVAAHGIEAMYPAFIKEVTLMKKACDASQNGVCRLFGAVAANGLSAS